MLLTRERLGLSQPAEVSPRCAARPRQVAELASKEVADEERVDQPAQTTTATGSSSGVSVFERQQKREVEPHPMAAVGFPGLG